MKSRVKNNSYNIDNYTSKNELKEKYARLLRDYASTRLLLGIAIQKFGSGLMIEGSDKTISISQEEYNRTFAGKKFDIIVDTESEADKIKVTMKFSTSDKVVVAEKSANTNPETASS